MKNITISAAEIAELVNGEIVGDGSRVITGVSGIRHATENDLSFVGSKRYEKQLEDAKAGIILVCKELAKERENIVVVNLLAGDYKFKKIGRIKDVKPGKYDTPAKTAVVVIERTKVSPLGRIFYDMKNGEKESNEIVFIYENEEWVCPIE